MVPNFSQIESSAGNAHWRTDIGTLYICSGAETAILDIDLNFHDIFDGDTECDFHREKHFDYSDRGGEHLCGVPDDFPRSAAIGGTHFGMAVCF